MTDNRRIWLIDATSYHKDIDKELLDIKLDYFRIKSHVRNELIGPHIPPTQRTFSMGLLRIATILSQLDYQVEYLHLKDIDIDSKLEKTNILPSIVAFSCVCPTIPICERIALKIKKYSTDIITVVGGAHINVALNTTMQRFGAFDRFSYGYDVEAVSRIINQEIRKKIVSLPYVDYSLLPYKLMEYDLNVFSTLGCPFKCAYCQDGSVPYFENYLDGGLGAIKEELKPRKLIHFFDSTLGYSEKRLLNVCNSLSNLKHDFIFSCDIRAEFINPETVRALENAGFKEIRMGLETVDTAVLKANNRAALPDQVLRKIDIIRSESSIYLTLYTVSGIANYTLDTYEQNINLYQKLLRSRTVDEIKNAQYVPYPRDGIDFKKRGIFIKDENWENYDRQSYPVYETAELTRDQIWQGYLDTARAINSAWLEGWGFKSVDDIKNVSIYPEYIVNSYLERGIKNDD